MTDVSYSVLELGLGLVSVPGTANLQETRAGEAYPGQG